MCLYSCFSYDNLVPLTKEETVLQSMIDRLSEIGRCCGMEMNVGKTKILRISGEASTLQIMIDQKQLENVEYFKCLGSMITNNTRRTCEIESRTAMAKATLNMKKTLFTSKWDLNLRKKLVKCYIWSVALYGAEAWTLRKGYQKYLKYFEMCAGEGWRRSVDRSCEK